MSTGDSEAGTPLSFVVVQGIGQSAVLWSKQMLDQTFLRGCQLRDANFGVDIEGSLKV